MSAAYVLRTASRRYEFAAHDRLYRLGDERAVPVGEIREGDVVGFMGKVVSVEGPPNSGATPAVAPRPAAKEREHE